MRAVLQSWLNHSTPAAVDASSPGSDRGRSVVMVDRTALTASKLYARHGRQGDAVHREDCPNPRLPAAPGSPPTAPSQGRLATGPARGRERSACRRIRPLLSTHADFCISRAGRLGLCCLSASVPPATRGLPALEGPAPTLFHNARNTHQPGSVCPFSIASLADFGQARWFPCHASPKVISAAAGWSNTCTATPSNVQLLRPPPVREVATAQYPVTEMATRIATPHSSRNIPKMVTHRPNKACQGKCTIIR